MAERLEYNQGSDLRTPWLPGLLLTPTASTQLSNKMKTQLTSWENLYGLPAPPGFFFRCIELPEWYFISDCNNSSTHLSANRKHFSNQIRVVPTQKARDPNLLQFSARWWEQQPSGWPQLCSRSLLQLLLGWPWTHPIIHNPSCNHRAMTSLPAPQRDYKAALPP